MKTHGKHTIGAALFVACALGVFAAANPALGDWNCASTDQNGNEVQWTLALREESGKLAGEITIGDRAPSCRSLIQKWKGTR